MCASFDDVTLFKIGKGVSDLETCMNYFALPERSFESLFSLQHSIAIRTEKSVSIAIQKFFRRSLDFSQQYVISDKRAGKLKFSQLLPGTAK